MLNHKTQPKMALQDPIVSTHSFQHRDDGGAGVLFERARGDTPTLFATLDRLGGVDIARVELTDQLNAGCVTRGFRRAPVLRMGLPLMQRLAVGECEAIIAHEIAHATSLLSVVWRALGGVRLGLLLIEGRGDVWRARVRWVRRPIERAWLALSRRCEFSADREAARLVGAPAMAAALVRLALAEHDGNSGDAARRLSRLMAEPPRAFDTHPNLAERLAALGVAAELPPALGEPGTVLFGDALARVTATLGAGLRSENVPPDRLKPSDCADDDLEVALTAAKQIWQCDGAASAAMGLQTIVARHGVNARVDFLMGRALIAGDDPQGLVVIERAMAADATARSPGAELLSAAAREAGDEAGAEAWQRVSVEALPEFLDACKAERRLASDMTLLDHRLDRRVVSAIAAAATRAGWVARIYAVRRTVREWLLQPGLHIVVVPRDRGLPIGDDDAELLLRREIEAALGTAVFVLTVADDARLLAVLERLPASRLF
jgi:predicted metallopeptidase